MSEEEYANFISELRSEIENPVYPNEIHTTLVNILESINENKKSR